MNKAWKITLAAAAMGFAALPTQAEQVGFDAAWVNAWLTDNGYSSHTNEADLTARRRRVLELANGGKPGGPDADQRLSEHLSRLRGFFPNFDAYPVYIQDSLLDADLRNEFTPPGAWSIVQAINRDDWTAAAAHYRDRKEFSDAELYFAAKDSYDAIGDKNSPAAQDLAATMSKHEGHHVSRATMERMLLNELAFLRYAREFDVERTWKRAATAGENDSTFSPTVYAGSQKEMNRSQAAADAIDRDNRQLRSPDSALTAARAFQFSVPGSTHGFSDISVPSRAQLRFKLSDTNGEDGDIQTIRLTNGAGSKINRKITLTFTGEVFTVPVLQGANELRITARNQGSSGLNDGTLRVIGSVAGTRVQNVTLQTGETGILRITGR